MERILTYQVSLCDEGLSVARFLKNRRYSSGNIADLKKMDGSILINGTPAYMVARLRAGDLLTVHIRELVSSPKIPPSPIPLNIVYEDGDLLVVNKPADMPIHPSMHNYTNSLGNAAAWYFAQQNCPFVFRCINRLDHNTSGLTVIAKHPVSGSILSSMVKNREIQREYLGIVRGTVTPPSGTVTAPLGRKPGSIIERTIDFENGESAVTHYHVVAEQNGHSLISLRLETGRTHQIRIHMKYLGFPLIGDSLYNPDMEWIGRQALHSRRLRFCHPITGEAMEFTAPLPEDMRRVLFPHAPSCPLPPASCSYAANPAAKGWDLS